eukprot:3024239-Pyramimonas_sp.AAC.1
MLLPLLALYSCPSGLEALLRRRRRRINRRARAVYPLIGASRRTVEATRCEGRPMRASRAMTVLPWRTE